MQREPRVGLDPTSPQDDAIFTGFAFPRVHLFQIFFQFSKSEVVFLIVFHKNNSSGLAFSFAGPLFAFATPIGI